ncbi:hypothetical protein MKW92_008556 [Papaver armeniacum]|nr:hypothetical protein MKW92_008556 [Papaver armeniacum]
MEVDSQGCTPLHLAITNKNVEMVRVLINANPNACVVADQNGGTPLHLASACGVPDQNEGTPLYLAAMRNEVKIVEMLIQSRPEAIHQVLPTTNETILHLCVRHDNFRAMEKLVDYLMANSLSLANNPGVISVNSVDSGGNTILHLAAQNKRMEMLKYFMKSDVIGIDVNIRNNEGLTALNMLDRKEMNDIGISCYDYNTREVRKQRATSNNESLKERLNTIVIVAALIAGVSFQAVVNPPGGVFQEDSKIDSVADPVMFTYHLNNVMGHSGMYPGFQLFYFEIGLPPQKTTRGNITADRAIECNISAHYDEIISYRINFVKDLLVAAKTLELVTRSILFENMSLNLAPGIVLEDVLLTLIASNYSSSTTMGGGPGSPPYLIRYAGTAILAYRSPKAYESYIFLNSISLVLCGLAIVVVTFDAFKKLLSGFVASIVGYLEVSIAVAVACISLSYVIVVQTIGPPFYLHRILHHKLSTTLGWAIMLPSFIFTLIYHYHKLIMKRRSRLRQFAFDQPFFKQFKVIFGREFWSDLKLFLFYVAFIGAWLIFHKSDWVSSNPVQEYLSVLVGEHLKPLMGFL